MYRYAIATNDQFSKKHNHPGITVHLAHTCDISQRDGFDKILPNIDKHGVQRKSQSLFLMMIKN